MRGEKWEELGYEYGIDAVGGIARGDEEWEFGSEVCISLFLSVSI